VTIGITLTAEANAAALRLRGEQIQAYPQLVQLTLAERWAGNPPQTVVNGPGAVPFFQLGTNAPAKK
jgi:hypothetical protein